MRIGGRPILEIIYAETDPRFLQAELDTYGIQAGGGNPIDWCDRMKGRLPMLHMKDLGVNEEHFGVFREIGRGNLNWRAIIKAAEASGCDWFIVEQDGNWIDDDPFKSLKTSFEYITERLVE
jgi:sugar phosphate isomerase/epimerase